jgi:hypothetical protein
MLNTNARVIQKQIASIFTFNCFLFFSSKMATSNRNANVKSATQAGNILTHLASMKNMIEKNDGIRRYSQRTTTAHDQQCPFQENELTKLSITHRDHHITHIADTFISMKVEYDLQWSAQDAVLTPSGTVNFEDPPTRL